MSWSSAHRVVRLAGMLAVLTAVEIGVAACATGPLDDDPDAAGDSPPPLRTTATALMALICPTGLTACGGRCVDTSGDSDHCGACTTACSGATPACVSGACAAPTNDTLATATLINTAAQAVTLGTTFVGAHNDTAPGCATSCLATGADLYYRFTLMEPDVVYVDTFGSQADSSGGATDTLIFLQDRLGNDLTDPGTGGGSVCDDDYGGGCSGGGVSVGDSRIVARLPAGTYYLVLKDCVGISTSAVVHFQHLPAAAEPGAAVSLGSGVDTVMGTTSGTGILSPTCTSNGSAPDDMVWFTTCPADPAQSLNATTCGTAWDTVVSERSALLDAVACNDDSAMPGCGLQSSVVAQLPVGAGLHVVYVDGWDTGVGGAYTLHLDKGGCVTPGFTVCGSACVNTQTDPNNCGACGAACSPGPCVSGVCRPPLNDDASGAVSFSLPAAGAVAVLSGSTADATNSAHSPRDVAGTADVWYTFSVGARTAVYVDSFGTGFQDTLLGVYGSPAASPIASNDDSPLCLTARLQSHVAVSLDPGTYYIAIDGYQDSAKGPFTLHVQQIPGITSAPGQLVEGIAQGSYTFSTNTTGSPTRVQCAGSLATAEQSFYWFTCPDFPSGSVFTASTCSAATTFDTVIQYRDSLSTGSICNDDIGSACTSSLRASAISANLPAGAGLHLLTVSGYNQATGTASVSGNRP